MIWTYVRQVLLMPFPWSVRRRALKRIFGYELHPTSKIGFSIVAPSRTFILEEEAGIGHLNFVRGMETIVMRKGAGISHLNWVYAVPRSSKFFASEADRRPELIIEEGGGITRRHLVDCSNTVHIGRYAMVAGYGTQILTHAVSMSTNEPYTRPVRIGDYSMTGTRCIFLAGSILPDRCALGAGSTLRNAFTESNRIYSGVPAEDRGAISAEAEYFTHQVDGQPGHRLKN